jgi:flagellar protein FlbD
MIHLTRLNNSTFTVNADLIKFVEQNPDTVITLVNGEKILVQEPVGEIVSRIVEFRRRLLTGLPGAGHNSPLVFSRPVISTIDESEG